MFCQNCGQSFEGNTGDSCLRCGTIKAAPQNQNEHQQQYQHQSTNANQEWYNSNPPPTHGGQPQQTGYGQPQTGYGQPPQAGYGQPQQTGYHGHGTPPNYGRPPAYGGYPPVAQPGRNKAIVALVLGLLAMTIPVPVIDIILGVVGLVLASSSKNDGYVGGVRTAAFVICIIGTVIAVFYTIGVLSGGWW